MKNRLVPISPGSDATWFKKQTFAIIESHNPNSDVKSHLTFYLDVYAYICNARPDEDFEKQGGELIVIVVQRGTITNEGSKQMSWIHLDMSINGMTPILAYPKDRPNNSDNIYKYTIDFTQSLHMFKDNGNSSFEALLEYQDDLTCEKYKQSVGTGDTTASWTIGSLPASFATLPNHVPFFGFSVFRSTQNLSALRISHVMTVFHSIIPFPGTGDGYSAATEDSKMDLNFIYKPSPLSMEI